MSTHAVTGRVSGSIRTRSGLIKRVLEWGGFAAGAVLIAFGIGAIVMGFNGRTTVQDSLGQEQIVGTPDMTPALIAQEVNKAGLTGVDLPDTAVAGSSIDTGDEARSFAEYMRVHALLATGGFTYSQMGQFEAKPNAPQSALEPGGGTSDEKFAVVDPTTGAPQANGARDVWVTETGLSTALNTSYMAERMSVFGIVVGVALLLTGIGFIVLAFAALHRQRLAEALG